MNRRIALGTALAAMPMTAALVVGAYPMLASMPAEDDPELARQLVEIDRRFDSLTEQMRELGYSSAALEQVRERQHVEAQLARNMLS
jgi:hypothetical protein